MRDGYEWLKSRIVSRQVTGTVIGLGYAGLPLFQTLVKAGLRIWGFDRDRDKLVRLHASISHVKQDSDRKESPFFDIAHEARRLAESDVMLICVPTPLRGHEPDLSHVVSATESVSKVLRAGQLVILSSTSYPGTTRDVVLPILLRSGLRLGEDFFVAYSPEREDPGRPNPSTQSLPRLVGGVDERSTEIGAAFLRLALDTVVVVKSAEIAEAAKLHENIYRAVNIALVNEMKTVLGAMQIDIWEVIAACKTKPFGFEAFYPGPGTGGHCIPVDPFYLAHKARLVGQEARFVQLAGEVSRAMPRYVVERTEEALSARGRSLAGSHVLVLGVAYKANIDDVRESPGIEILRLLEERGAQVAYCDPHVPVLQMSGKRLTSTPLTPASLQRASAVVIATDHAAFDFSRIGEHATLVVDTRNCIDRHVARAEVVGA